MEIIQHLLVLLLVVAAPLWDWYEIPRLKASTYPGKKIRFYVKIIVASWMCALVALATVGIAQISSIHSVRREISWLDPGSHGRVALEVTFAGLLVALFLPAFLAVRSERLRTTMGRGSKKLAFLLPSTGEERRWWWPVCLTAGICEEVVYRGFLLHYLHVLPWHVSLTWALVFSSLIFGAGHLYQGISAAASTVAVGFLFGGLFVITGSLLLPILIHTLMDLRALVMLPEGFESAATSVS